MNLMIGLLLIVSGLVQWGVARDRALWVSYAIESFRFCVAWGLLMLGGRFLWIFWFGDEPGVSLWAQASLIAIGLGMLGLQMNNLTINTMHVPRFLRKSIE